MRNLCLINKVLVVVLMTMILPQTVQAVDFFADNPEAQAIIRAKENAQNPTVTQSVGYDSQGGQVSTTGGGRIQQNTSIDTVKKGEVVSGDGGNCSPDENTNKQLADIAYNAVKNAYKLEAQINDIINKQYLAPNGDCHYLYDTSAKWWDEALRSKLHYTEEDIAGAKKVDKSASHSPSCSELVTRTNSENNYTDWNFRKMLSRAASTSSEMDDIYTWAATSSEGSIIKLNSDTSEYICSKVQCKKDTFSTNDCNKLIKKKGNAFACYDTGIGSKSQSVISKNGKCYVLQTIPSTNGLPPSTVEKEVDCNSAVNSNDIAYTFNSVEDFKQKVPKQNSSADKCVEHLNKLIALRGSDGVSGTLIDFRKKAHDALASLSGAANMTCYCQKDENGNMTNELSHCDIVDDSFTVDNMEDECKTIPEYQAELQNYCVVCGLFANIMHATQDISSASFDALSSDLIKLLTIAYLIYLGYITLITIASPEAQKISKYLTSITLQGFKVAVAVLILQSPKFLYGEIINPILESSVDFSLSISAENSNTTKVSVQSTGASYTFSKDKYLSSQVAELMTGATAEFSRSATMLPSIGRSFICWSWHHLGISRLYFIPRFAMLIQGILLYLFGMGIMLALGFYLLDAVIRLAIVCALMAFFIACWPFKLTAGYTKTGWNMFLNIFFQFIIMSVIILTINVLAVGALPDMDPNGMSFNEITSMLNGDQVEALNDKLDLVGLQIVMLVICCYMAYKLTAESNRLANKFAAGAKVKMGGNLGGLAASAVKSVTLAGGKTALGAAGNLVSSAAEHSGAKAFAEQKMPGLMKAGRSIAGSMGIGSKAKIGTKGRNANANSAAEKPADFRASNQGDDK